MSSSTSDTSSIGSCLADGDVGIVTVLHERMHQMERFRDDFGA